MRTHEQHAKPASRALVVAVAALALAACNRSSSNEVQEAQPPTLTSAELPQPITPACAGNFAAFDHDGDHRISLDEFQSRPHASPDPVSVFRARDRNGDGFLSEGEFCARWEGAPGHARGMGPRPWMGRHGGGFRMGAHCEENFAAFDTNHDGTVTEQEFAAWPHVHGDAATIFAARDQNHDGILTKDEFCAPWRTK